MSKDEIIKDLEQDVLEAQDRIDFLEAHINWEKQYLAVDTEAEVRDRIVDLIEFVQAHLEVPDRISHEHAADVSPMEAE